MKTTLVTVVAGEIYEKFSEDLFSSAEEFFHPTEEVEFLMLPGTPGWPEATLYRWHHLTDNMPDSDFVFLSDADMRFEAEVGPEILPRPYGITAVLHPGYVGRRDLPYENRKKSTCYVEKGRRYYAGGFVGGSRFTLSELALDIEELIAMDSLNGIIPIWHDESALNKVFSIPGQDPWVVLSPAYCYPEDDTYYKTIWREQYERKLVAVDKSPEQRVGR